MGSIHSSRESSMEPSALSRPHPYGPEYLAGVALAGGLVAFAWAAGRVPFAQLVLLGGLLVFPLGVLLRRVWLKTLGPVAFYELLCVARRERYVWLRMGYVA